MNTASYSTDIQWVFVLIYYYGNTANNISRDLTGCQNFIIRVWPFRESKCFEIQS